MQMMQNPLDHQANVTITVIYYLHLCGPPVLWTTSPIELYYDNNDHQDDDAVVDDEADARAATARSRAARKFFFNFSGMLRNAISMCPRRVI
jgi:hypothetical protein